MASGDLVLSVSTRIPVVQDRDGITSGLWGVLRILVRDHPAEIAAGFGFLAGAFCYARFHSYPQAGLSRLLLSTSLLWFGFTLWDVYASTQWNIRVDLLLAHVLLTCFSIASLIWLPFACFSHGSKP
jgi:hypothetical protein